MPMQMALNAPHESPNMRIGHNWGSAQPPADYSQTYGGGSGNGTPLASAPGTPSASQSSNVYKELEKSVVERELSLSHDILRDADGSDELASIYGGNKSEMGGRKLFGNMLRVSAVTDNTEDITNPQESANARAYV